MAGTISPFYVDYPGSTMRATDYRVREALKAGNDLPPTKLQQAILDALDEAGGIAHNSVHLGRIVNGAGYHGNAEQVMYSLLGKRRAVLWRQSWLTVGHDDAWAGAQMTRLAAERDEAVAKAFGWCKPARAVDDEGKHIPGIIGIATGLVPNLEVMVAGRGAVPVGDLRHMAHDLQHLAGRCRVELDTAVERQELIDYLDGEYRTHHIATH